MSEQELVQRHLAVCGECERVKREGGFCSALLFLVGVDKLKREEL
jgi:hypothetical protein